MTAVRPAGTGARRDVAAEAAAFLAAEAHLLDDRAYERWFELFTPDCLYWMPVDPTSTDGRLRLNVVYDDRPRLRDRIARLTSGEAYTEDPPALTARVVGTVHVDGPEPDGPEPDGPGPDDVVVRSAFTLVAHRLGDQRLLAGRYRHRLRRVEGALRIVEKRVSLLGSDHPQRPMTFLF